jgi:hypothetical protein
MISWHLIQGCTFGLELVDGTMVDPNNTDWFIVIDLFLVRAIVNF